MAKKHIKLFEYMCGEFVSIVLNFSTEHTVAGETSVETTKSPVIISGYVTDEDDDYLYLGQEPNTISQLVKKEFIILAEVSKEETEIDSIMNDIPTPDKGKFN